MVNKIIDKNKISKESQNNRITNGGGVGSTDLLGLFKSKQFFMFVEIIPCYFIDIERKATVQMTDFRRTVNDLGFCKASNNSISDIKLLSARLLDNVRLENIYFVFSESLQVKYNPSLVFEIGDLCIDIKTCKRCHILILDFVLLMIFFVLASSNSLVFIMLTRLE